MNSDPYPTPLLAGPDGPGWICSHANRGGGVVMRCSTRSLFGVMAGTIGFGPAKVSAQATVDLENRYPNVGVVMVWRVDEAGKLVEPT